uniref:Uncharacterized protein n=1 Tax=Rhizophora mucronata TaxID=61149 RepID=A0A2P2MV12_RHIMU
MPLLSIAQKPIKTSSLYPIIQCWLIIATQENLFLTHNI